MREKQKLSKEPIAYKILLLVLCAIFSIHLSAQNQKMISGKITDEQGESVIGASVFVKGTTVGTVSDIDGNFSLEVPESAVITISYIGYLPQDIRVEGRTDFAIVLKEDNQLLDEVVVVGYGVMRKRDLTGAVASVSGETMKDKPVASIGEALQGRAAGVQVISSGKPGDNVSFRIRGISTINNSEPLLVIDGVPTDLGINALNMEDVETVDVLKDASATAIYGSRGANGVILITTKRVNRVTALSHSARIGEYKPLPVCLKCLMPQSLPRCITR